MQKENTNINKKPSFFKRLFDSIFEENVETEEQFKQYYEHIELYFKKNLINRRQKIYFVLTLETEDKKIYPHEKYSILEVYNNDSVAIAKDDDKDAKAIVIPQCLVERFAVDDMVNNALRMTIWYGDGSTRKWDFWQSIKKHRYADYDCVSILEKNKESLNILSTYIIELLHYCNGPIETSIVDEITVTIDKLMEIYSADYGNIQGIDKYGSELSTYNHIKRIISNVAQTNGYKDFGSTSVKEIAFKMVNGMAY